MRDAIVRRDRPAGRHGVLTTFLQLLRDTRLLASPKEDPTALTAKRSGTSIKGRRCAGSRSGSPSAEPCQPVIVAVGGQRVPMTVEEAEMALASGHKLVVGAAEGDSRRH